MTVAAAYLRFSSDNQVGGESIEYQLEEVRKYADANGLTLDESHIYVDEAKTGKNTQRDSFQRCLANAKNKPRPFDTLLIYNYSRLCRNQDEFALIQAQLRRLGVELISVTQPNLGGLEGKLLTSILTWVDEFQSVQIGAYAHAGQKQLAQRGYSAGGKAPYGYRLAYEDDPSGKVDHKGNPVRHGTYEIVEDTAAVVLRIFEMYAQGGTMKGIVVSLNAEGIPSPGGSTWSIGAVRTILHNQAYAGDRVWNQTRRNKAAHTVEKKSRDEWVVVRDSHPAIVLRDLFDRVRRRIENRRPRTSYIRRQYMLSGLIVCTECGARFTISSGNDKNGRYYRCSTNKNRGKQVCGNSRHLNLHRAEQQTLEFLFDRFLNPSLAERSIELYQQRHGNGNPHLAALTNAQQKCQIEMQNLVETIRQAGPMPEFLAAIKSTQDEIDRIEAQIKEEPDDGTEMPTLADAVEEIEYLRSSLENPDQDVELKRNILAHLIHQIKIPPRGHGEMEYYDPQQHLPMVLAKKAGGGSQDKSRLPAPALQVVTPRGHAQQGGILTALFLLGTAHSKG